MNACENTLDAERKGDVPPRLADDSFYRALAARPRRRVLAHLLEADESTIPEITDVLYEWETTAGRETPTRRYEQLQIALKHKHLPCLEAADLIEYKPEELEVSLRGLEPPVSGLVRCCIEAELE
jgi:hypothetical protein